MASRILPVAPGIQQDIRVPFRRAIISVGRFPACLGAFVHIVPRDSPAQYVLPSEKRPTALVYLVLTLCTQTPRLTLRGTQHEKPRPAW